MNKVLLISEDTLKTFSYINDNCQSDELRYAIMISQNIEIQESLGSMLFQKMLDLVNNDDIFLPANAKYKKLLDEYISPTLTGYALYRALDNFIAKFMSVGLVQNRSEQGNPVDFKLFLHLKGNAKNDADFQNNILRRHLIFKSGLYPEYTAGQALNEGKLPPVPATPFTSPITLPGSGFYWSKRRGGNFNAMGPLCGDSPYPTWYGHTTNS